MAGREKEVGIRLSVKDKDLVERALRSLGKEGQEALQRISGSADKASVSLQALNAAANGVNRGMDRLKVGVGLTAAAIGTAFVVGIKGAIERLEEMDKLSAQVDRALSNTGNTAQTSAAELADFADELEKRTGRAAEEIMAIGGNLATFKFDHEVFYRSIELANDMSAAWGGELKQNLEGLSRALADPEKGFAMLEKRGISLTEAQGDLVARFVAVNDLASAQRVILSALEDDVKGVAEQGMTPLQKATLTAQKALEDLFEDLVRGEEGSDDLRLSIERAAATLSDPNVLAGVRMFGTVLVESLRLALDFIGGVAAGLQRLIDFFSEIENKSDRALSDRMIELGLERRDITNAQLAATTSGRVPRGNTWSSRLSEIDAEEKEILAAMKMREAAASLTKPLPSGVYSVTPPGAGDGELPPPVATKDQQRAQTQALKEAERLTEKLRTASEAYAATVADLDSKLSRGLITHETHNRAVAAAALELADAAATSEDYRLAQDALSQALADGIISEERYTEAVEAMTGRRLSASKDWISGIERGLRKLSLESGDLSKDVEGVLTNAASGFEDALVSAFKSGKLEWDDLANSIAEDMIRLTAKQAVSGLAGVVGNLLGGVLGGGAGAATGGTWGNGLWGTAIFNADGNVYSSPGLSAYSGRIVNQPTVFPFADGIGMMGEAGPEAIIPLKRGADGKLGVGSSGGSSAAPVEIHVHPTAGQTVEKHESTDSRGRRRVDVVLNEAVANAVAQPRGPTQRAIAGAGALASR